MNKYLVINAGSSSLKFSLYETPTFKEIVNGCFEKIGEDNSFYTLKYNGKKDEKNAVLKNHTDAVKIMLNELINYKFIESMNDIKGVGHRILHGGEYYNDSVLIDELVFNRIVELTKLGPLHHPGEIEGIKSMIECLPNTSQVAVFDTAFHQTIPKENYMYPIPYEWYKENGVRKYGFHGTSHKYITTKMQEHYNKKDVNIISCHIGSGASIACIKNGLCYNTTMGLTPLDGLMMGTRSGSIDPSIIEYICKEKNMTYEEVTNILNKKSGFLGISGKNDYRDVNKLANEGNENAILAIKMFEKSVLRYIYQYYGELEGNIDALVFTAGLAENNPILRENIVNSLSKISNVGINKELNNKIAKYLELQEGIISTPDSKYDVFVLPTDEEYMILKDTYNIVNKVLIKK